MEELRAFEDPDRRAPRPLPRPVSDIFRGYLMRRAIRAPDPQIAGWRDAWCGVQRRVMVFVKSGVVARVVEGKPITSAFPKRKFLSGVDSSR